jgi:hypothetical protein
VARRKTTKLTIVQTRSRKKDLLALVKIMMQHVAALVTVPKLQGSPPYLKQTLEAMFFFTFF